MAETEGKGFALGFPESKVPAFTRTSMSDIPAVYRTGLSSCRGESGLPHLPVCPNKYIHVVQGNLNVSISSHLQETPTCIQDVWRGGSRGGMAKRPPSVYEVAEAWGGVET